jgi:hypothetical protein
MFNKNIYIILLNKKFVSLSEDVIYYILELANKIHFRNGKYIGCIKDNDIRYNILKQIRRPIFYTKYYFKIIFYYEDKISGFMFQYYYQSESNSLFITKSKFIKTDINNNKNIDIYTSPIKYILNANGGWSIIKNYSM